MAAKAYDTIIVGGGPAGCVLASRLSENATRFVLLVEAGPDYGPQPANWPDDLVDAGDIRTESHAWGYTNAGQPPIALPRSRVVGGCSTINACLWMRGSRADYDLWEALGNPGWGFDDLLPFFTRAEADPDFGTPLHGQDGPMRIHRTPESELTTFDQAILGAAARAGIPPTVDVNDPCQGPAAGIAPRNIVPSIHAGRYTRWNTAFGYLAPARTRPNLTILPDTLVDRLTISEGVVTGIRTAAGEVIRGSEVVLAAGAYGSPAILLRSGIGPAAELERLGIKTVADVSGVGKGLMDHPVIVFTTRIAPRAIPNGPSGIQTIIKARSRQVDSDFDLHLLPTGASIDDELGVWRYNFWVILQESRSRGALKLASANPHLPPVIDHAYFSDPIDLEALCDGVEIVRDMVESGPLAALFDGELRPGPSTVSRPALRDAVRERVRTTFHPSCTCRMGPDADALAVVDPEGRVRGVSGVRVADTSIFPIVPRANTHWPVIATAERIAALMAQ